MPETTTETLEETSADTSPVSETGEADTTPEAEAAPKGNREARYRVERNQAREERDALASRLEALQTRELHRLAGEHLAQPEDIGLSGQSLEDFLTPEGWVDAEAVAEAAAAVIESRPGLAKNPRIAATDSTQGLGGTGKRQPDWADLLRP